MPRVHRVIAAVVLTASVTVAFADAPVHAAPHAPASPTATYTVKSGDYLYGIAATLKVNLSALLAANNLTVTSVIYPGMTLQVPAGGVTPRAATVPAATQAAGTYTVRAGDYLALIASRMGVKLGVLLAANKLTTSSVIHPGNTLLVPAGGTVPTTSNISPSPTPATAGNAVYVVKSGDFLLRIASTLGVTTTALLAANKLTINSMLHPGQKLVVPAGGKVAAANSGTVAAAPANGNARIDKVLAFARAQLGKPYKFAAAGPDAWDCSGLTMAAFAEIGISLPHYSGAQAGYGTAIDWRKEAIRPGDLVFLETYVGSGIIGHVGIAISATQWIQAPRTGDVVRIGAFPSVRVIQVRRIVQG